MPLPCDDPTSARIGIDYPDIRHAHGEAIVETLLEFGESVVRREDLDTDTGRRGKNLLGWLRPGYDANIGHSITAGRYTDSLFGKSSEVELAAPLPKPGEDLSLETAVIIVTHVAFEQNAIDKVTIRAI